MTDDPRPKSDFGVTHDNSLEGANLVSRHSVAPSVFLSDSVVDEAVKKGFRLSTYRYFCFINISLVITLIIILE